MLHGCGQDAGSFAVATRMNRIAARERFLVLYPEQDRMANAQGCWNWFDTRSGRAYGEAQLIMGAVEQVCLLYPVDRERIAIAGLSAGASMAALLVTRLSRPFQGGDDALGDTARHRRFDCHGRAGDARQANRDAAGHACRRPRRGRP